MAKGWRPIVLLAACLALAELACASSWQPLAVYAPTETPGPTLLPGLTSSTARTATARAVTHTGTKGVWLADYLPDELRKAIVLPEGLFSASADSADYRLELLLPSAGVNLAGSITWIYALAAPFPTVEDAASLSDLQDLWRGRPARGLLSQGIQANGLLVDESSRDVFTIAWGEPGESVHVLPAGQILDEAWASDGSLWAILPFEQLEPRWKVIAVDGQSPVQKSFDSASYALAIHFGLAGGDPAALPAGQLAPASNRDPARLTTVALTGVTALVRATAAYMERLGMTYPAKFTGSLLREADILHINNEVPFAEDCPAPLPWEGLVFCSQPRYIELLDDIGTDVVELSGDHFADWGAEAMLLTLDMYQERGWATYGGGANSTEASQPAKFEHNGNKIAFVGCNAKPPGYATADETTPGAIHCDMEQMAATVQDLRQEGYLPIVTFQHLEYYAYTAHPILVEDFTRMAQAGAVIVSGSQAHQPHAMDFEDGAFLHYGLGNLFFDQHDEGKPTRQAFIDRHVFYDGHYISTELVSIWFVDYAVARPMKPDERKSLLRTVFQASGW